MDFLPVITSGTPWQPEFGGWAFNLKRGEECVQKWNLIPRDTDVLVTHRCSRGCDEAKVLKLSMKFRDIFSISLLSLPALSHMRIF